MTPPHCGCRINGINDRIGWHTEIIYCPLHAAALRMHKLAVKLAEAVIRARTEGSLKAYMPVNMAEDLLKIAKAEVQPK